MVLPLVVAAHVFFLPESPRSVCHIDPAFARKRLRCADVSFTSSWLLLKAHGGDKRKYLKAFDSLRRLRHSEVQAARDLFLIHHLLQGEDRIKRQRHRFVELWSVDRNRRALLASLIVMIMQQLCGVNVLSYVGLQRSSWFCYAPPISLTFHELFC